MPDRDRTGRLREVYWASRVQSKSGRAPFLNAALNWWPDRATIGRRSDEPGDGFVYLVSMAPRVEHRFEWLEVTEVFTTVAASRIEGAMRAWNRIYDKHPVDFEDFRRGLPRGRPSRIEQRSAADRVIEQIERKLAKTSYQELLKRYGYGTLVVGMPLWFAVPPDDPLRAMNAIDDFMTRTALGLEDVKRRVLGRRDCPFGSVVVTWDTTPQALREWHMGRSSVYEDTTNASLDSPMGTRLLGLLSSGLEETISRTETPESKAPSMSLRLDIRTTKRAVGKGPYPKLVDALRGTLRDRNDHPMGRWAVMKERVALALCKLLCFVRIRGMRGLERWLARKLSLSHAWQKRGVRRTARRLYWESRRRGRAFGRPGNRMG